MKDKVLQYTDGQFVEVDDPLEWTEGASRDVDQAYANAGYVPVTHVGNFDSVGAVLYVLARSVQDQTPSLHPYRAGVYYGSQGTDIVASTFADWFAFMQRLSQIVMMSVCFEDFVTELGILTCQLEKRRERGEKVF